jgi:hypothetical protein
MTVQLFSSNADLYSYLERLGQTLASQGANDLAAVVRRALRFAVGMTTEFLGESRAALRVVSQAKNNPLGQLDRQRLAKALSELDSAFNRWRSHAPDPSTK